MITALIIVLSVLALFFALKPIFSKHYLPFDPQDEKTKALEELMKKKNKIYNDIKDLDFEYRIGHMAENDYQALRKDSLNEASKVLQKIDTIEKSSNGTTKIDDAYIEKLIRSQRKIGKDQVAVLQSHEDFLTCPTCQCNNNIHSKFCSQCGAKLTKDE